MKIVLAGGTGLLGQLLGQEFGCQGHEVVVLSRQAATDPRVVTWDGRTLGDWARELDGADAVVNLAGRSVNCRYNKTNLAEMLHSRVDSARVVGQAISEATHPPSVWLQMSTATIYSHRFDAPNDEATGQIGGNEPGAPAYWRTSVDIANAWEEAQRDANTPATRKVALRTAMVMAPVPGSVFAVLLNLTRWGLGGPIAGGGQYVSWIHARDFVNAVRFLIERDDLAGPINLAAPNPVPQREFMATLRSAWGARVGLPATRWMVEIGAFLMGTDSELLLKSRRVIPGRLCEAGFTFEFPEWPAAARDLIGQWRTRDSRR